MYDDDPDFDGYDTDRESDDTQLCHVHLQEEKVLIDQQENLESVRAAYEKIYKTHLNLLDKSLATIHNFNGCPEQTRYEPA